jgi:hypothetical protein
MDFYWIKLDLKWLKLKDILDTRYIYLIFLEPRTDQDLLNKICFIEFGHRFYFLQFLDYFGLIWTKSKEIWKKRRSSLCAWAGLGPWPRCCSGMGQSLRRPSDLVAQFLAGVPAPQPAWHGMPKRACRRGCRAVAVLATGCPVLGLLLKEAERGMAGGGVPRSGPKRAATRRSAALGSGRWRSGQKKRRRHAPPLGRRHGGGRC